jgi:hypothetical protein
MYILTDLKNFLLANRNSESWTYRMGLLVQHDDNISGL